MVKATLFQCYNEVNTVVNCKGVEVHLLSLHNICEGTRSWSAVNFNYRPPFPAKSCTGNPLLSSMFLEPEWTHWTRESSVVHSGEQNNFRPDPRVVNIYSEFLGIQSKFLDIQPASLLQYIFPSFIIDNHHKYTLWLHTGFGSSKTWLT